jgi:hypothetical protein
VTPAEAQALEKSFNSRQAGLAPPDRDADELYCDALRVVPSDRALPGYERVLTKPERSLVLAGRRADIRGRVMLASALDEIRVRDITVNQSKIRGRRADARRVLGEVDAEAARWGVADDA